MENNIFSLLDSPMLASKPALENDTGAASSIDLVEAHLTQFAADQGEIATGAQAVFSFAKAVANCDHALNSLTENQDIVADAIKTDAGLTPREAALLKNSLKGLEAEFGEGSFAVPALENIGGDAPRSVQSEIALENLKDRFSAVYKRIIEMLVKFKEAVKGMWRKLFGSFETLKRAADAADKKFGSLGDTLKSEKIKVSGLDKLAVGAKADYNAVPAGITTLTGDVKKALDAQNSAFQAFLDAAAEHVGADVDDGKLKSASEKVAKAIVDYGKVGSTRVEVGGKQYTVIDLMGAAGLLAHGVDKVDVSGASEARADAITAALKETGRKVGAYKQKVDGKAEDEVAPWKQAQIVNVGTEAGKIADILLDLQKQADAAEKGIDDVINAAKKRQNAKVEEDKKALAKEVALASTLSSKVSSYATVGLQIGQHVSSVTKGCLALANKTAGAYA